MIHKFLLCVEEHEEPKAIKGEQNIMDLIDRSILALEGSNYIKRYSLRPIQEETEEHF